MHQSLIQHLAIAIAPCTVVLVPDYDPTLATTVVFVTNTGTSTGTVNARCFLSCLQTSQSDGIDCG